jgi:hypothetical protein
MADTTIKLSGTYDSIEAYRILEEMREMSTDYEEIKEEAEAAVTTATAAATTAQGHANNASTYADNAQTYAGNANTSAGAAAGSASTASTAASNALSSETAAAESASAASTSETNAAASATAAAASAAEAAATLDSYLPLSGGTMTGDILSTDSDWAIAIDKSSNDGIVNIRSVKATYKDGAWLKLCAVNSSGAGLFELGTGDGTNWPCLIGKPDGTLIWNGLGVALYKDSGYGYFIISNDTNTHGVQICWGAAQNATSAGITVTFPKAFPTGSTVRVTMTSTVNSVTWVTDITNTNFKAHSVTTAWANFIAIANF